MQPFFDVRDALVDDLKAAWPGIRKVHTSTPELVPEGAGNGWVLRKGPIVLAHESGSSRNHRAYTATISVGGQFARKPNLNIEDERMRLAQLLFDRITATHRHGGAGQLEEIVQMLELEVDPGSQFFTVDVDFRFSFLLTRADAV
jgi:hypothetical protein